MSKKGKDEEAMKLFHMAANATIISGFNKYMNLLKNKNISHFIYINSNDRKNRAASKCPRPNNSNITSKPSESFNNLILPFKGKSYY